MVTEQLVNFMGMTGTKLPDFGGETLILLLYQLPLDRFLFVVVCLDHAYRYFCLGHACRYFCLSHAFGLTFYLLLLYAFCVRELHRTSYFGAQLPPDRQS